MYVIKTKGMKPGVLTEKPALEDICYLLDTDDCIVERYTYERCQEIAKTLNIFGILKGSFCHTTHFYSLLDGDINIKADTLKVLGKPELIYHQRGYYFVLCDYADKLAMSVTLKCDPIERRFSMIWAEKIGRVGYRVILEYFSASKGFNKEYHWIYLFLDNNYRLYIERVENNSGEVNQLMIQERYKLPVELAGRLAIV